VPIPGDSLVQLARMKFIALHLAKRLIGMTTRWYAAVKESYKPFYN